MGTRPFEEGLIEQLKGDSEFQAEYIKSSFEENYDMPEAIEAVLLHVAEARNSYCFLEDDPLIHS